MNVQLKGADDRISVRKEEVEAAKGQDDVIEHMVDQLQPFTTYEFAAAAATAAGQGPFSNPLFCEDAAVSTVVQCILTGVRIHRKDYFVPTMYTCLK